MLLARHSRLGMLVVELRHDVVEHFHVLFHMHMALTGRRLLRLNQHGLGLVPHLLDALEGAITPAFGPHGRRQQERTNQKQGFQ
ncbi:hypothetical protein D3C78_1885500 [compost metagenome]